MRIELRITAVLAGFKDKDANNIVHCQAKGEERRNIYSDFLL